MLKEGIQNNKKLIKSISLNVILKPFSMLVSFFYTPILLSFLGNEQYGVWITMLSVLNWLTIFDFGIGGGFRNLLSQKLANNDDAAINDVSSTAYISLASIISILYVVLFIFSIFINWNKVFNTTINMKIAMIIVLTYICLNFIFGLSNSIFYANQKAEYVPLITFIIQSLNFFGVFLIGKLLKKNGSITEMALLYAATGICINVIVILIIWIKNKNYIPHIRNFKREYVSGIFNYGIKLFFLQICGIILFTTDNMIITQLYSPEEVTPYSITRNLFNIINSVFSAILAPFWSKFTIENEKKNYSWIKKSIKYQLLLFLFFELGVILLLLIFKPFTRLWLGKDLLYPDYLTFVMAILISTEMFTGIFSNFLNGVSYINSQLVVSIIGATLNIPISIVFARYLGFGITGVCMGTVCSQLLGVIVLPIISINYLKNAQKNILR